MQLAVVCQSTLLFVTHSYQSTRPTYTVKNMLNWFMPSSSIPVLFTPVSSTQHFYFYLLLFAALLLNFHLPRFSMPFLKFWGYSFKYDVQIPKSKLLLFLEAPHYLRFGSAVLNAGAPDDDRVAQFTDYFRQHGSVGTTTSLSATMRLGPQQITTWRVTPQQNQPPARKEPPKHIWNSGTIWDRTSSKWSVFAATWGRWGCCTHKTSVQAKREKDNSREFFGTLLIYRWIY